MENFDDIGQNIDIVNLGNSHSLYGFMWKNMTSLNAANLALGSQTLIYDNAIFQNYLSHFEEGSILILGISFRTLYENGFSVSASESVRTRYYSILNKDNMPDWKLEEAVAYNWIPVIGNKLNAIKYIFSDETFLNNSAFIRFSSNTEKEQEQIGYQRAQEFLRDIGEQVIPDENKQAISEIIISAQKKKIRVILVTVPTSQYFSKAFPKEFFDKFYSDIEQLCTSYKVEYLDYTNDSTFNNMDLFMDSDHLNAIGSECFTKKILDDIGID